MLGQHRLRAKIGLPFQIISRTGGLRRLTLTLLKTGCTCTCFKATKYQTEHFDEKNKLRGIFESLRATKFVVVQ